MPPIILSSYRHASMAKARKQNLASLAQKGQLPQGFVWEAGG